MAFSIDKIRQDFPLLLQAVKGRPVCYLDNAATAQKPQVVIDALTRFYTEQNANVHRGAYYLSQSATDAYEAARRRIAHFLNAASPSEIVFTRNATEAINLVAAAWGRTFLKAGDEIILSSLEHHANIVPWQLLAKEKDLIIKVIPLLASGDLDFEAYTQLFTAKTRFVAITAVSNTLGTVVPLESFISYAHANEVLVLVDACQAVPHFKVDIALWQPDFLVFTGHKLFGPNGIGVLYGRAALLSSMPPYQGGGGMIERVAFEETTFRAIPERFEAGTPAIADAIGLAVAIDYLAAQDTALLEQHEAALLRHGLMRLQAVPSLRILGNPTHQVPIVSFVMEGVHPHDLATYLDSVAICVRAGHHCTQPLMRCLGVQSTVRASFAFYNTFEEVDHLADTLLAAYQFFK